MSFQDLRLSTNLYTNVLLTEKPTTFQAKLIRNSRLFHALYICIQIRKLREAIFFLFYNITHPNLVILLIEVWRKIFFILPGLPGSKLVYNANCP